MPGIATPDLDGPVFPPGFSGEIVPAAPLAAAAARARAGAEPATVLWSPGPERVECGVILATGEPMAVALRALIVGMVALHDALAAHSPPEVPITLGWPDRVMVNDGLAGGVRLLWDPQAHAPADVPSWMVLGVQLAVQGRPGDMAPGREKDMTNLREEGFGDVAPWQIVDSFARFLLSWMNRWEEEGFAAVRKSWLSHAHGLGLKAALPLPEGPLEGLLMSLTPDGDAVIDLPGGLRTVPLMEVAPALPTWHHLHFQP